jgi:hypothetical protein
MHSVLFLHKIAVGRKIAVMVMPVVCRQNGR